MSLGSFDFLIMYLSPRRRVFISLVSRALLFP